MSRVLAASLLAIWTVALMGCGTAPPVNEEVAASFGDPDRKIRADAYQFSSRVWQKGKPTTFRLELYVADTVIGISGYGYLGKGALKARVIRDTLEAFFPTENEYLVEPLVDLISPKDCPFGGEGLDIHALLTGLPDDRLFTGLHVTLVTEKKKRREYTVEAVGCDWQLELDYRLEDVGWRVRNFKFAQGQEFRLRGNRQRFRGDTGVKLKRFLVPQPSGAPPVTP